MKLLFAFLCSAIGFTVQWREQWLPKPPTAEALAPETPGSWFHGMKNVTTEWFRADPEWWSKFCAFVIVLTLAKAIHCFMAYGVGG